MKLPIPGASQLIHALQANSGQPWRYIRINSRVLRAPALQSAYAATPGPAASPHGRRFFPQMEEPTGRCQIAWRLHQVGEEARRWQFLVVSAPRHSPPKHRMTLQSDRRFPGSWYQEQSRLRRGNSQLTNRRLERTCRPRSAADTQHLALVSQSGIFERHFQPQSQEAGWSIAVAGQPLRVRTNPQTRSSERARWPDNVAEQETHAMARPSVLEADHSFPILVSDKIYYVN